MDPKVEYVPDETIDDVQDAELRGLLTTCFTKSADVVFKHRRYFVDPYPHRWVVRNDDGALVAHVGVHDKVGITRNATIPIAGVCEVCVHPDCRGRKYVKIMLRVIHDWLREHGYLFVVLFGEPAVYGSSGYALVSNIACGDDESGWKRSDGLVFALTDTPWPDSEVRIPGKKF